MSKDLIETAAKAYSKERGVLADLVSNLNDEVLKLHRKALPTIKKAVNATKEAEAKLEALLKDNVKLFERPRTWTIHGIKFGFAKQKGCIEIPDVDKSIKLIRKNFPEKADLLIVQKESISKEAVGNLSVDELKKIGCNVVADTDAVVIKPTDSHVDKLVTAMLKSDESEELEA